MTAAVLIFHPLTPDRWDDLEALFGPERGAGSGCWCMWWRVTRKEWEAMGKAKRKVAFRKLVKSGAVPGILAYRGAKPVGWCAIAPRETTPSLDRSRVAKPVDDSPVWSITCFYIDRAVRERGVMAALIEAACDHAARNGATLVEAYPIEPARSLEWGEGFVGIASAFSACGFSEVARRTPTRPVMRRALTT